ncbi:MAG TPA: type II toxin-antitoxin system prevent-host-death family antitoxin [Rhodanobacteraceae bacterium]
MHEIGAFQAKNTLGTLLDRVANGEEIVITRRGKPAARLVSPKATVADSSQRAIEAIARIRARARSSGIEPLTQSEWTAFRNEGHR